jgi:hypothetical protein
MYSESRILKLYREYSELLELQNPNIKCETYLKEKVAKL